MKVFLVALLVPLFAHASVNDGTSSLDFTVQSSKPGCVQFTNVHVGLGFPYRLTSNDVVTQIRFYFSALSVTDVTPTSHFVTMHVTPDGKSFSPTEICAVPPGRWYVKYGLANQFNQLVEFMNEKDFNPKTNIVDVQSIAP